MKKITLLIIMLLAFDFGFGQTKLAEITFETPGGYTTNVPEFTDFIAPSTDGRDYFLRTDGSNIRGEIFTNQQGSFYFAAQDTHDTSTVLPLTLLINNINISGYSNLEFRVHIAEDDSSTAPGEFWDNDDYVHFNYDIDNSSSFSDLLWIEGSGGTNTEPLIDTNFDGTGDGTAITNAFTQFTENIPGTGSLLDIEIVFRLNAANEDIAIDNIEIWGTLIPCAATVTWDGSSWTGGTPDITTVAELNGDYDTGINGSFSACELNVNSGTLTIADNTFVEVQNDLIATGNIIVEPQGAFVQNSDFSTVTNTGLIQVNKLTAPMNAWYEYTYWSSPVSDETIEGAIDKSNYYRRFEFNAQNYLDATAETNNNGATLNGQDDIDDDGNDWVWIGGNTIMQPGKGYATTLTPLAYNSAPGSSNKQFSFAFEGSFNNGVYTVPVYRNDSELDDNNWNLIGNPYPSAIDIDLFLAANTEVDETNTFPARSIVGAVYLWSQNTAPSGNTNGNAVLNFTNSDYAIINSITALPGGDGVTPSRYIPSGQAFLVSYSNTGVSIASSVNGDGHTIAEGEVTFNNAMRATGNNDLFFKKTQLKSSANLDNKIHINLTSDNGVFNQIAVGYVNGATDFNDGSFYDAPKNGSANIAASLYTTIVNSNKQFAIQGKAKNSLDIDEIISLGFSNNINTPTLFTLSIDHLQGDFLTGNTIYLKDNLLNKLHDLSASDYTFTSEIGEFNERFEIIFNTANVLSTDEIELNTNKFSILNLDNNNVQFNTNSNLTIKTISVFDLLGRQVYDLSGKTNSETYNLTKLKNTVYIAKIELSNGLIITKKAIKN